MRVFVSLLLVALLSSCVNDVERLFDLDHSMLPSNTASEEVADVETQPEDPYEEPEMDSVEISSLEDVTPEEEPEVEDQEVESVTSNRIDGWDSIGNVNILSERFINKYLYNFSLYDFAGITRGMTRSEVESRFGSPHPYLLGYTDSRSFDTRYNDLGVFYFKENSVDSIYINPVEAVTK